MLVKAAAFESKVLVPTWSEQLLSAHVKTILKKQFRLSHKRMMLRFKTWPQHAWLVDVVTASPKPEKRKYFDPRCGNSRILCGGLPARSFPKSNKLVFVNALITRKG